MAANKNKRDYWTESRVKKLFSDELDWMLLSEDNVFVRLHLLETQGIGDGMITYLVDKFSENEDVVALWDNIKELEKMRLVKGSLDGKYKENMTKFLLNCKYDYVPKTQQQIELKGDNIKFDFGVDKKEEE